MSLWSNLANFTAGLVEGLARGPARAGAPSGYDFRAHMRALAEGLRLPLASLENEAAAFVVCVDDTEYTLVALLDAPHVILSVASNVEFPPHGAPPAVVDMLRGANAGLPRCDYDVINARRRSFVCVKGSMPITALTPASLEAALHDLLPAIIGLDRLLEHRGYAR